MIVLDYIIALFDPLMRNTLELRRLNKIWEDFNENKNARKTQMALLGERWKYHKDRAHLLLTCTILLAPPCTNR